MEISSDSKIPKIPKIQMKTQGLADPDVANLVIPQGSLLPQVSLSLSLAPSLYLSPSLAHSFCHSASSEEEEDDEEGGKKRQTTTKEYW